MAVEAGIWDWPDRGLSARGLPLGEEVTKTKKGGVRERRCEPNEGKRGSRHTGSNLLLPWAFIAGLHSVVNLLVKTNWTHSSASTPLQKLLEPGSPRTDLNRRRDDMLHEPAASRGLSQPRAGLRSLE